MRSTKLPSWIERLAGLAPVPVPPHVFQLRTGRLDYGRFEREGAGVRCLELASRDLPGDAFQRGLVGGPLREPGAFEELVGGLVKSISAPVKEASLVLPDAWLRISFTESGELPTQRAAREELLRWRLKRQVPFRVEELRVRGWEVTPLAEQEEPCRVMLAFGLELLFSQLEAAFAAAGVHLGQITNASLSLLAALEADGGRGELEGVLLAEDGGYSLLFARAGEPVLHRYKPAAAEMPGAARAQLVERDLRLTRTFLAESFPDAAIGRVVVAAPAGEEDGWIAWLAAGLGAEAVAIGAEHLPSLTAPPPGLPWSAAAPILGAALREVA